MRPLPLIVHVQRERDAICIVDALAAYSSSVVRTRSGWDVKVASRSMAIAEVLTALHECMAENEIRFVRVTIDGHTYAMEPAPIQR